MILHTSETKESKTESKTTCIETRKLNDEHKSDVRKKSMGRGLQEMSHLVKLQQDLNF